MGPVTEDEIAMEKIAVVKCYAYKKRKRRNTARMLCMWNNGKQSGFVIQYTDNGQIISNNL